MVSLSIEKHFTQTTELLVALNLKNRDTIYVSIVTEVLFIGRSINT